MFDNAFLLKISLVGTNNFGRKLTFSIPSNLSELRSESFDFGILFTDTIVDVNYLPWWEQKDAFFYVYTALTMFILHRLFLIKFVLKVRCEFCQRYVLLIYTIYVSFI